MQEEEYIIINKKAIQKRIEELGSYNDEPETTQLKVYQEILSQSAPLIPEIEKALYAKGAWYEDEIQDYILNLKLDI